MFEDKFVRREVWVRGACGDGLLFVAWRPLSWVGHHNRKLTVDMVVMIFKFFVNRKGDVVKV